MAESGKNSTAATIGAIATLITAIGGLLAVLHQTGFFDDSKSRVEVVESGGGGSADLSLSQGDRNLPVMDRTEADIPEEEVEMYDRMESYEEAFAELDRSLEEAARGESLNTTLVQLAQEINQICPYMVDQVTRLDNAAPMANNAFQYNYTLINIDRASVDLDYIRNYLNTYMVNMVKTSPDLQFFRDNSVTLIYSYKDMHGNFLTSLRVTPEMYRN